MVTKIKYIKGYDRKYKISTKGTVWSIMQGSWKKLKPCVGHRGHLSVRLFKNGKVRCKLIHKLVLETFQGPCPIGMVCRHFPDRNPANNNLDNLQWGTYEENSKDRIVHGTIPNTKGERAGNAKLTEKKVLKIRKLHKEGMQQRQLGKMFCITEMAIHNVVHRKTWKHI